MEKQYHNAVELDDIPGVIVVAQDTAGKFSYAKAWGKRTLLDRSKKAQEPDDILNTYSSSKLITTIAVLQCVEKGLFTLEEDVSRILPEVGAVKVLTSIENDTPQYAEKREPITLQLLLTHSSGYSYDLNPPLSTWRAFRGEGPFHGKTTEDRVGTPLIFQPGTDWKYGVGVDWAGKMVERVTGLTLEEYYHKYIFQPLGIELASYWPLKHEAIRAKMIDLNPDDPKGGGLAGVMGMDIFGEPTDCSGGGGCYMSPVDFVKVAHLFPWRDFTNHDQILHSLLANDKKLLESESVDLMFQPHLPQTAHRAMNDMLQDETMNVYSGQGLPVGTVRDYGYGGMINLDAQPGWYGKNTMFWSGGVTLVWFIDREAGLCGMAAPQFYMRDTPARRKEGEEPKPWREGGMLYEDLTRKLRDEFRQGIYGVYEEWKKGQS